MEVLYKGTLENALNSEVIEPLYKGHIETKELSIYIEFGTKTNRKRVPLY